KPLRPCRPRDLRYAGARAGAARSAQACTVGHWALDRGDHHARFGMEAGQQELRAERADLLFRKIDDAHDLPADQLLGRIERGDLRAGLAFAVRPEIGPYLPRRL